MLDFIPDQHNVELKSLKLYLWSFRDEGAFHEAMTNRIADNLIHLINPRICAYWDAGMCAAASPPIYSLSTAKQGGKIRIYSVNCRPCIGRNTSQAINGHIYELLKVVHQIRRSNGIEFFIIADHGKLII
jgi:Enzyme related to GTP cyclohydrolase I